MASDEENYRKVLEDIRASFSGVRQVVKASMSIPPDDFDVRDGISLLSTKNDALLSYCHSLVLMSCHRILGHSLADRTPPPENFSSLHRSSRGTGAGDLVDFAIETRAILEKTKALESRMKYQIEKLVRLAEDSKMNIDDIAQDPLAFRPNIESLVAPNEDPELQNGNNIDGSFGPSDGIYRPPKLAPVPYSEAALSSKKKDRAAPVAKTLSSLTVLDASLPYSESTSGLGGGDAMTKASSAVRNRLDDITRYEEENMTRLLMNKKETKRRKKDEGDIALGGMGGSATRGGGLEEEFSDVLRAVHRRKESRIGDGYEELRQRGRKVDAFERSQSRKHAADNDEQTPNDRSGKRSRFSRDTTRLQNKAAKRRK